MLVELGLYYAQIRGSGHFSLQFLKNQQNVDIHQAPKHFKL